MSLVHIGEYRILLAHHQFQFRPHGCQIGLPELERLSEHDFLAGWTVASLETAIQQPDWAREVFEELRAACHR